MRKKINAALMANLPNGPIDIRDTELVGFTLRVYKSGRYAWRVEYGRGQVYTLPQSQAIKPAEARRMAKALLGDVARGVDIAVERKRERVDTLQDFLRSIYGPWVTAHRKGGGAALARINRCFDSEFGSKKLADITPWSMEKWRTRRL